MDKRVRLEACKQKKKKNLKQERKRKHNARVCVCTKLYFIYRVEDMEDDDNGELDVRNTYNARTSKFLATTWRKSPEPEREPISLLLLIHY